MNTKTAAAINWSLPIEFVDGRPAKYLGFKTGYHHVTPPDYPTSNAGNYYLADGTHYSGFHPAVRNVVATALDTTKTLTTRDGKPVKFVGRMEDGQIVIQVTYPMTAKIATELRRADGRVYISKGHETGDDVIVKITKTARFFNVYADGSMGDTAHGSENEARSYSKYGKVRVGVLKQELTDGKLTSATMLTSLPWFRNRSAPLGRYATAADY